MKTILITGGAGFLGTVLTELLLERQYRVICLDRFFFGQDLVKPFQENNNYRILKKDSRKAGVADFEAVDAVVDLAGISNDPACELNRRFTVSMNFEGPFSVARTSKMAGVPRYIMASSCSIYGAGSQQQLTEDSEKNPVSLYAKAKIKCENENLKLASQDFCVTFLRLGTLFGLSYRMRFDLIVNIMTLHALTKKQIFVHGAGTQWRPLLHVRDAARALIKAIEAPAEKINRQAFNVGSNDQNYQAIQVARTIQQRIPEAEIVMTPSASDERNYNVNFGKIRQTMGFTTKYSLIYGIDEIKDALLAGKADPEDIRSSTVKYYTYLFKADRILQEIKIDGKIY
jgi:nucleoside-diphosphate-sugar epimerase